LFRRGCWCGSGLVHVFASAIAICAVFAGDGVQASPATPTDTSPLPTELEPSEHGQVFDEAIHILGGNVNVISQWTGEIRLVVVGDTLVDAAAVAESGAGTKTAEMEVQGRPGQAKTGQGGAGQGSASFVAGSVVAEVAELTGLQIAKARDSYDSVDNYLQSIRRAARFSLSDCDSRSGVDHSDVGQAAASESESGCGNFFVVIADVAEMEAIAKAIPLRPVYQKAFANPDAVKCFFSPFQTGYMEIKQALVFVRRDLSRAMVRTCLQEEIYQSFGMFNDFSGSRYYSFNNKIEPKVITRYDRALLQTIYEPGFRHGAPVFAVVKKLMERLGLDPFASEK